MKLTRIARYVDLLFCLVIMPLVITLLPVDRWIVHNTAFLLTLVVYIYGLYFIYRRTRPAHLFLQHKYLRIVLLMLLLVGVTELLTHFPMHESSRHSMPASWRPARTCGHRPSGSSSSW